MNEAVTIIDGMTMVQKTKTSGLTFGQLAKQLFITARALGSGSSRIDAVFDQYMQSSFKSAERRRRGIGSLVVK